MSENTVTMDEAIKANIYVHAFLANSGEYNKSPHFRPENQEKVRNVLLRLTAAAVPPCLRELRLNPAEIPLFCLISNF